MQIPRLRERCIQCRTTPQLSLGAAFAEVHHRPVTSQTCQHGPYCPRCRNSVALQVLPFCVCRALVQHWRESPWPTKSSVAETPNTSNHPRNAVRGASPGQSNGVATAAAAIKEAAANPGTASFVSWDAFATTSSSTTPLEPISGATAAADIAQSDAMTGIIGPALPNDSARSAGARPPASDGGAPAGITGGSTASTLPAFAPGASMLAASPDPRKRPLSASDAEHGRARLRVDPATALSEAQDTTVASFARQAALAARRRKR